MMMSGKTVQMAGSEGGRHPLTPTHRPLSRCVPPSYHTTHQFHTPQSSHTTFAANSTQNTYECKQNSDTRRRNSDVNVDECVHENPLAACGGLVQKPNDFASQTCGDSELFDGINCGRMNRSSGIKEVNDSPSLGDSEDTHFTFVRNASSSWMESTTLESLSISSSTSETETLSSYQGNGNYVNRNIHMNSVATASSVITDEETASEDEDECLRNIPWQDPQGRDMLFKTDEPSENEKYMPPDELYQPEEDDENEAEQSPFDFNLKGAVFHINHSKFHLGPKYDLSPAPMVKSMPKINMTSPEVGTQLFSGQDSNFVTPPINIGINPSSAQPILSNVSNMSRSPALQTKSVPVTSAAHRDGAFEQESDQRLSESTPPLQTLQTLPMLAPTTPTTPGNITISGGSIVLGTQYVFKQTPCNTVHEHAPESAPVNSNLETLLAEVREKLSTVYIRQTKTSFLPWLRGHQVISMTEFYTESRILAVDKHGKITRQTVDLHRDLVDGEETRFLVEGEPGMGKTLLALKLTMDWANKKNLQQFKFVFLIFLRDFKGSLEKYVKEELLPSNFDDKFKKMWEYCKNNEKEVLFILDGYDELEKPDEGEIQKLLVNRDFQNSKVVVTSRPDVLKTIAQRTIVKGFSEVQMFEFIGKYFKLFNKDECGISLKRIIEKDYKYRKLAKRPLFCVLLCMLYESDGISRLPEKLSDMMFKIMLCLIKWNVKKVGHIDDNTEAFPSEYEDLFLSFGKLCLQALKTEKTRFSKTEIKEIGNYTALLHLGFLSNDSENNFLGPKKFWKPVHKIFLEYLAGLYMANHIGQRDCRDCRECREFSTVYRHEHVLKFVVGILGKRAHLALDGKKHPVFLEMKDQELLMLLREAGPTRENCRAVAKLLDRDHAQVCTSDVDFEGWSFIVAQNFRRLKSLEIVWRIKSNNPDQESSFNEATPSMYADFFDALKSNTSITKIRIRATQDGEPFSERKIELFFSHLKSVLPKENLRELEIKELKVNVSSHLRNAFEGATCQMDRKTLESLEVLRLDMFLDDCDLQVVCDRLKRCAPNLKELQLTGLIHGPAGFKSLVDLIRKNKSLHKLCISMNKANLVPASGVFLSQGSYTPSEMRSDLIRMPQQAVRESRVAFQQRSQRSQSDPLVQDPTRELSYLFSDHLHTGNRYTPEARKFWFIKGENETKLPLPLCISREHESVFHDLFSALPESSVRCLTLDYPSLYLSTADLVCLGDAIRKARHLTTLKLHGLKTIQNYMPILLGLGQSQSLTSVMLDSNKILVQDTAFQLACSALRHNTTLKSLSLGHWEFNIKDKNIATRCFYDLLGSWKVTDLNLDNSPITIGKEMGSAPTLLTPPILLPIQSPSSNWSSIRTLRLAEVKLVQPLGIIRRGHLLLPILRNCPNLTSLDLSASRSHPTSLDDRAAQKFFEILSTDFKKLRQLTLGNWEFKFEHYEETCSAIGHIVRSCSDLKVLMLDKVNEVRSGLALLLPCRTTFLHQLVNNLPRLAELSLCYYRIDYCELDRDTASRLGSCFHDHWNSAAKFELKFFGLSSVVEIALLDALKKENFSVSVTQGYPLIYTVKRRCFLST